MEQTPAIIYPQEITANHRSSEPSANNFVARAIWSTPA
jgi:hypothetical protein